MWPISWTNLLVTRLGGGTCPLQLIVVAPISNWLSPRARINYRRLGYPLSSE
ncbi:MAG: hypothetical protein HYR55_06025 [Acidobacteria bacterium]|nr:hypothetical protein [Acidobacteriota bacterium]MBI3656296.1 hypothetical protein [Acidobacteriota bacterium]